MLDVIANGFKDALLMAWEVWWALVLGFAISAIVQAWVPRERIERVLSGGGWEYNAVLIAAMAGIVDVGPGRPSVDAALFPKLRGPVWAALAVGSGVAGSYLVTERLNEAESTVAPEMGAGDPASPNGGAEQEHTVAGA